MLPRPRDRGGTNRAPPEVAGSPWRWLPGLVALLTELGCASPHRADPVRPVEVIVPTEVTTLDPRFATRSLDVKLTRLVHAGLIGLDETTLEPVPLAAESFRWVDARTFDVELRVGVRFHGGKELTAEDVCATIEAVRDPALGSPHRAVVDSIARCVPRGARGVRLSLAAARATVPTDLELPILRADQARAAPSASGDLDGLGPFAVRSVERGAVTLTPARTDLFPVPRHVIVVRTIRDENARAARLLAGKSDVAPNAISPSLLPALEGREGLGIATRAAANVTYLLFQNDRAPFRDAGVRHAVARAIDRDLIARTLLAGRATPARSWLPPDHWASMDAPAEPFDPEGARSTLEGRREVTLLTSTERARVTVARAVAQMLGDAGLPTVVIPLDLGAMLARLDAGDFEMAILQIPELTEPNVLSWFFHPRGVPGEGGPGRNRGRYRSAEAAALFDAASETRDREARRAIYRQLSTRMASDLPAIPLWHEAHTAVVSPLAHAFRPSAEGRWAALSRLD